MTGISMLEDGQVVVPPGRYYVGDPGLAMSDEDWQALGATCGFFSKWPVGQVNGVGVAAFQVENDGSYESSEGDEVFVNSGLIGIVPASVASEVPEGMFLVEFEDRETCEVTGNHIWIGQTKFRTSPGLYEEEDEDEVATPPGP